MKASINVLVIIAALGISTAMSYADEMNMPESPTHSHNHEAITGTGTIMSDNKDDGYVTIKHQAIPAIGWPAMTMKFKVADKMLLNKVNKGDKVQFSLVQQGKDYVVNEIK